METVRSSPKASWTYDIENREVCAVAPSCWKKRILTFFLRQLRYECLQQFRYIDLRVVGVIKENGAFNPTCGYFVDNLSFRVMNNIHSK